LVIGVQLVPPSALLARFFFLYFAHVPRLLVTGGVIFIMMPWMWRSLSHYTLDLLTDFHKVLQ